MTETDAVGKKIVQLNLNSKMPVIALGMGFDANINFLSFLGDVTVIGKFPILCRFPIKIETQIRLFHRAKVRPQRELQEVHPWCDKIL